MNWKYKIPLESESIFDDFENEYDICIPKDLKSFILENNAASPEKDIVNINGTERVYEANLTFNKHDGDPDSIYLALQVIKDKRILPFAIDPFGNYFCYSLKDKTIVFWNHEESSYKDTSQSLAEFIESLR